jgi:two-component system sensor kinase FixL
LTDLAAIRTGAKRGGAGLGAPAFAKFAGLYLVAYFGLNLLIAHRALNGTAITLWSPDNALSVMLIMESSAFAPLVWATQIVADLFINHTRQSTAAIVAADSALAAGYVAMAAILSRGFGVTARAMQPRDLIALMAVAPMGAALTGLVYCSALWLVGEIRGPEFAGLFSGFWIGDAAAMSVLIPATGAIARLATTRFVRKADFAYSALTLCAALAFLMLVIGFSASSPERRYLFNLLYLPIIMLGLKFGYDAGAATLLFVQLFLLAALDYFQVPASQFGAYQVMMFVLAVAGQALGATISEWESATSRLRSQQAELAKVSERATNSMLAAAMAHEISQPLSAIAGYVHGARRLVEADAGRDKALGALAKAEAEAARARAIVERLRDFVAAGTIAREAVDLDRLIEQQVRLGGDAARARTVTLKRVGDRLEALHANVDRVGVEQALNNLVVNAIEAAPAGVGEVCISLSRDGATARLAVEDNGPGVAAEIAGTLFEPFETTKPRGMGLGLPLAREIARRHGGDLRWNALEPRGTRFELELPLA